MPLMLEQIANFHRSASSIVLSVWAMLAAVFGAESPTAPQNMVLFSAGPLAKVGALVFICARTGGDPVSACWIVCGADKRLFR